MMKFMQKKMNKKGFTLIELIVVIAVIGILVLLAAPRFLGYVEDAQITRIMHDVKVVDNKVEETLAMDKEAFNAEEVTQAQLLILVNEGKLFDLKGQIVEPDSLTEGDTYKQVSDELVKDVRTKLKGKFYLGTGGKMYYEHTNSIGGSDVEEPVDTTYLATDDDFSGITDGGFRYIGTELEVRIPHVIKGVPVTSYKNMFRNTSVTKVVSDNPNITDMNNMFYYSKATSLDLSSFDTSSVTDMGYMLYGSKATSIDLSSFNTSNVTTMSSMFSGSAATSLDLSSFNTSNVTTMSAMFMSSAATSLDLSSFDTTSVTNMVQMFMSSAATSLDLSSFDTSNVTNMDFMFNSSAATSLNLSSFNTTSVTNMSYMFNGSKATTLDLSSFDTTSVTNMNGMFNGSATSGYARTQTDADKFNASSGKPSGLTFILK